MGVGSESGEEGVEVGSVGTVTGNVTRITLVEYVGISLSNNGGIVYKVYEDGNKEEK